MGVCVKDRVKNEREMVEGGSEREERGWRRPLQFLSFNKSQIGNPTFFLPFRYRQDFLDASRE